MDWPLPSFSVENEDAKSWMKEYLGEFEFYDQTEDQIPRNNYYLIADKTVYLTYGPFDSTGPAIAINEKITKYQIDRKSFEN